MGELLILLKNVKIHLFRLTSKLMIFLVLTNLRLNSICTIVQLYIVQFVQIHCKNTPSERLSPPWTSSMH